MSSIRERAEVMTFVYADQDPVALATLKRRLTEVGREKSWIEYGKLVEGIDFRLPNVEAGGRFRLGMDGWSELHRNVLGSFLGRIAVDSYLSAGFFASALAVSSTTKKPSGGFGTLMRELGALSSSRDEALTLFWSAEMTKAYD
ncbi:MAG TPA: hypothetical protein VE913_24095, partial [Longimicrobium sp.]|nr:hypothetical protein [Longimicrobium sp.]